MSRVHVHVMRVQVRHRGRPDTLLVATRAACGRNQAICSAGATPPCRPPYPLTGLPSYLSTALSSSPPLQFSASPPLHFSVSPLLRLSLRVAPLLSQQPECVAVEWNQNRVAGPAETQEWKAKVRRPRLRLDRCSTAAQGYMGGDWRCECRLRGVAWRCTVLHGLHGVGCTRLRAEPGTPRTPRASHAAECGEESCQGRGECEEEGRQGSAGAPRPARPATPRRPVSPATDLVRGVAECSQEKAAASQAKKRKRKKRKNKAEL